MAKIVLVTFQCERGHAPHNEDIHHAELLDSGGVEVMCSICTRHLGYVWTNEQTEDNNNAI